MRNKHKQLYYANKWSFNKQKTSFDLDIPNDKLKKVAAIHTNILIEIVTQN